MLILYGCQTTNYKSMYVLYKEYVRIEVLALESYRLIQPAVHVGNISALFRHFAGVCLVVMPSGSLLIGFHGDVLGSSAKDVLQKQRSMTDLFPLL